MDLIESTIPAVTVENVRSNILTAQSILWQLGITGVHDYDQTRCFSALQILDAEHSLRLRVVKSIPYELLPQAAVIGLAFGLWQPISAYRFSKNVC